MSAIKLGVIVGSTREASINLKLAKAMARLAGDRVETRFIPIDALPFYDLGLERNRPDTVNRFTDAVAGCDALLVVTPEFNRSLPAVLKNAIDWGSKPADKNVWRDKPAMIAGASPGAIGTSVAQQHLRQILGILGALVMGGECYISFKPELIDDEGVVSNDDTRAFLQAYVDRFVALTQKLAA